MGLENDDIPPVLRWQLQWRSGTTLQHGTAAAAGWLVRQHPRAAERIAMRERQVVVTGQRLWARGQEIKPILGDSSEHICAAMQLQR
jgi:hypothetical protein